MFFIEFVDNRWAEEEQFSEVHVQPRRTSTMKLF